MPFDLRGLIQLGSESAQSRNFPEAVRQIKVARPAWRFHFLHAVSEAPKGKEERVGAYIVHFTDHQTRVIPLVYGRDLRDWWTAKGEPPPTEAAVAWQGSNPAATRRGAALRLFMSTWENPVPRTQVESIDFVSSMSGPAPFLVAITVE